MAAVTAAAWELHEREFVKLTPRSSILILICLPEDKREVFESGALDSIVYLV
jgi:hypothetical protein